MSINIASIMDKVKEYSETDQCKKKMKSCIEQYRIEGQHETAAGGTVVTLEVMEQAAVKLAQCVIDAAEACDLPASVMGNIKSISCSRPYRASGVKGKEYRVDLFFTDDLSRQSLYDEVYDGVTNIIALFNNGYLASDRVYGSWDNHRYTGEYNILRSSFKSLSVGNRYDYAYVPSKIARPALQFMQKAVDTYNIKYGELYGSIAILDDIYEEIPTVAQT